MKIGLLMRLVEARLPPPRRRESYTYARDLSAAPLVLSPLAPSAGAMAAAAPSPAFAVPLPVRRVRRMLQPQNTPPLPYESTPPPKALVARPTPQPDTPSYVFEDWCTPNAPAPAPNSSSAAAPALASCTQEAEELRSRVTALEAEAGEADELRYRVTALEAEVGEADELRSRVTALEVEAGEAQELRSRVTALEAALEVRR